MATREAIAQKRLKALRKLDRIAEVVGGKEAVSRLEGAGRQTKNPDLKEAFYLEELADVLGSLLRSNTIRDDTDLEGRIEGIGPEIESALKERGYITLADVRDADDEDLLAISGIGPQMLRKIRKQL